MFSKAERLSHNVWSSKYFAISIGAIIVLFAINHWVGKLHAKYSSGKPSRLIEPFRALSQLVFQTRKLWNTGSDMIQFGRPVT